MPDFMEVDRLDRVLADNPWLVRALLEADWWIRDDGSVRFSLRVDDLPDRHEAMFAFVEALGMELRELPAGSGTGWDVPDEPPMSLEELRRCRRAAP